jgi:hypothetical protein
MTTEAPASHAAPPPPKSKKRLVIGFGILVAVIATYALSLFGFYLLSKSTAPVKAPDLNATDDTVVLVRVEELKTVANRLAVKVLVYPQSTMWDPRLLYPAGKSPAQVATTLEAHGNPNNWPFDSYTTDTLSADVLVGSGDDRKYIPARVEVAGALDGWDVSVKRVGEASQESDRGDNVIITLHRAKGPLIFDLGICLVLFSLPVMALAVSIAILLRKRKFIPPFVTWFAAVLFAIIPIRNFLPGAPPAGAWIDQALVIWVLIALVVAMGLFMLSWYRQTD